jgi:hypothetical protein
MLKATQRAWARLRGPIAYRPVPPGWAFDFCTHARTVGAIALGTLLAAWAFAAAGLLLAIVKGGSDAS